METFNNLVLDPYCGVGRGQLSGGRHRYRRYDDFRIRFKNGQWNSELLPHRAFVQSPKFNAAVGGVPRKLDPLEIDPGPELDSIFTSFGFDTGLEYHVKLHQIRVLCAKDIHGVAVTEGPHRDGQEWQIVAVFKRHNISGGESQFLEPGGSTPFFAEIVPEGHAICNIDAKMWHNATDIFPLDESQPGHRDIWILGTNRWTHRRYGEEFEEASTRDGLSDWTISRPADVAQVAPLRQ